ncbi:MAG: UvrD-helicase domain-containing protein [Acidimicrobiales bacterium]
MTGTAEIVDQSARDRIARDALDDTLFVEAGAGSGKTRQLVDRIVNLIVQRGVPLTSIAAITFTEAAAAELQSRIRVRLETEIAGADDPLVAARCTQALADADLAAISTLHGFASRLVGEFAIAARLPPRVRVLDEVSSQLAHEDRWARFVDALYDDPANDELLTRARLVGVALESRYGGQATFKDVADVLTQNWDRLEIILDTPPPPLLPLDFGPFDEAVARLAELPPTCTDPDDKFYVRLTEMLLPEMTAVVAIDDPHRKLAALGGSSWTAGNGGKNAAWGGDAKACKALVGDVGEAADAITGPITNAVLLHLLALTARHVAAAAEARRDDGGLEFHDLLVLARNMLRSSASVRRELHDRFTHVLLDEFQDTDPLQIDLATLIAAGASGDGDDHSESHEPASWAELEVEPGRLFFVGDPKQSIYRFRRADIGLFLAAAERFGGDGRQVKLVTNFRTVEPILDWVNALFETVMPDDASTTQAAYEPLLPFRRPDVGRDHRPVLLGGPHPDPKVRAGQLRDAEAADVARLVQDIREHPDAWPVFDESLDGGRWRPARLDDVTILVPTRTSLPYLRAALDADDVPYRLATGTLVYDTQEVRDAIAVLRAVDDPTDELSLVAALRSPLYACSDVDLATYRAAGGRWNLRSEVPESVPVDHPVALALSHLRGLWDDRWWLSPSALLERVLRERRAALLAFGDPRPREVWRRLRFLVDQARAFEESGGGDLRAFIEWTGMQGADGARVHEPMLAETDDDALQILTIHGAKGLEFPITILSGMTTKPAGRRAGVSVLWTDGEVPQLRMSASVATADHEPRADLEAAMDEEEKLRLLYVAATRARDHLVVSCHHQTGAKANTTYAGRIWEAFEDRPDLCRPFEPPPPDAPVPSLPDAAPVAAPVDDREQWVAEREAILAPQREPRVTSATAVARAASAPHEPDDVADEVPEDDDIDDVDDLDETTEDAADGRPPLLRRRGRRGSAIGRAVHATLEVVDFADPHDVEAQVVRQCRLESIPDLEETVLAFVQSALGSSAVREAASAVHHKELYVAAPVGQRVIEGYIDLLIERPDGLVIVDYKTDSAATEHQIDAALDRYELQGASYAAVLEAVTGLAVVDCRFVFCRRGGAIERSVRDLPSAIERVRRVTGPVVGAP